VSTSQLPWSTAISFAAAVLSTAAAATGVGTTAVAGNAGSRGCTGSNMLHSRGRGSDVPCIASAAVEPVRATVHGATLRGRSSASSARSPSEQTCASATPSAPLAPEDRSCKPSERNGWRDGQGAARLAMRVRVAATRRLATSATRAPAAVPGSLETRYAASASTAAIWYDSASSWPRRSADSAGPYTCSRA
ncbi:hypothetical protein Vretimale_18534, partial [Volvox reticuliferus]